MITKKLGRKPLNYGEAMKSRHFRATDRQWADIKLVTPERVRQWASRQAAKMRKAREI